METYLEDHAAELRREQELLALGDERINDEVFSHVWQQRCASVCDVIFVKTVRQDVWESRRRVIGANGGQWAVNPTREIAWGL